MAFHDYDELQAKLVRQAEERGHPTGDEWAFELWLPGMSNDAVARRPHLAAGAAGSQAEAGRGKAAGGGRPADPLPGPVEHRPAQVDQSGDEKLGMNGTQRPPLPSPAPLSHHPHTLTKSAPRKRLFCAFTYRPQNRFQGGAPCWL
jgi:hypothetical protein